MQLAILFFSLTDTEIDCSFEIERHIQTTKKKYDNYNKYDNSF